MHELACPSCNSPSQYELRDYLLMCPFCSATFRVHMDTGQKEIYGDHYIVPNTTDPRQVKTLVLEWLRRLHHKPTQAEKEFFVTDIKGFSVPFWVISLEAHSVWKGLVQKSRKNLFDLSPGSDFLMEEGQFRRSYRWAIFARKNLYEIWALTQLHEPIEKLAVIWDGFPLDSTFSRGRLIEEEVSQKSAYDVREFFEFKFANGLPILGIQVDEDEALRRARNHVELYHYKLARLNVDHLVDIHSELDIAGIQLIHLPFWHARYVYHPRTSLRYFYKAQEKNVLLDGYGKSVLKGELAILHHDKVWVNAIVCAAAAIFFFLLGGAWHPAFFFVAIFALGVAGASAYLASSRKRAKALTGAEDELEKPSTETKAGAGRGAHAAA